VTIYRRLPDRLQAAGARAVAVTSIAGHFCIDAFKAVSLLPVVDMLAEVDRGVEREGLLRVGIIGTRVAMETRLYGAVRHAQVVAPPADLLLQVHDAYSAMAVTGAVTEAQRALFFSAGRVLVEDLGAEAVLLGGTDLGLAFAGRDPGFRTFDCAAVHAAAIAEVAAGCAQGGSRWRRSGVPAGRPAAFPHLEDEPLFGTTPRSRSSRGDLARPGP